MSGGGWWPEPRPIPFMEKVPEEKGVDAAERRLYIAKLAAQAEAERMQAEFHCPPDLVEWGKRNRIPEFSKMTWQAGFITGFRLAIARVKEAENAASEGTEK